MQYITVSHFTNPNGEFVHQVMVGRAAGGGMPVIAETTNEEFAWAKARELASGTGSFRGPGVKYTLCEWNGDTGVLTEIESGVQRESR